MKKSTCFNCNERTSDCHTYCEMYKAFKAERDAELERERKEKAKAGDMYGYHVQKYKRLGK